MAFYRKNWYYIGSLLFVALAYVMGFWGQSMSHIQTILIYSYMALLVHQFEEYALPGGFPAIWNMAMSGEKEVPDRYPLNKQSSMFVNTFCAYTFYLAAIIFPSAYWLGILTILFGFAQFLVHGIIINRKMKSFYNPGLGAVVFLHIPIGCYYLWYVATNVTMEAWNWWVGIIGLPFAAFLMIQAPIIIFKNKNSPHTWSQSEMSRFSVKEKLDRRNKR